LRWNESEQMFFCITEVNGSATAKNFHDSAMTVVIEGFDVSIRLNVSSEANGRLRAVCWTFIPPWRIRMTLPSVPFFSIRLSEDQVC
jgi:hypothetical protein